ncbi:SAM-dependent methyltransferase [Paenibacillus sp. HWE-109]|uniref:class I SAM-dependent methyltransferase n=1 Tax=Paenibacillus sp. HWE-109 TaxID=1306526 RepID=UPI001EDDF3DE|nr:SAM-dependent methyltransferase [Paenibacillus sp. HWE-109]UKS31131.1 SAM-dependent methyltransferase [Paenibacillus sp. HWE-109]
MKQQLGHPEVVNALIEAMDLNDDKAIPFHEYMAICLYSEPYGYYRNENPKIGKQGDFYTSSSIGSVMGEMIAAFVTKQAASASSDQLVLHLVEWGGGSGRMAFHIMEEIKNTSPAIYDRVRYTLIESSAYHRELQRTALQDHAANIEFAQAGEWLAQEPQEHLYVLANELLDAFPVHRIRYKNSDFQESYVHWRPEEQEFQEIWRPIRSERLLDFLAQSKVQWLDGQIGEINLEAEVWIAGIASRMENGSLLVIDYGDVEAELYAPHRYQGTFMCYRQHQAHDNPWIHQGEQDMTAHIDFSFIEKVALQSGFADVTLQTQREFLVEQGILQKLQDHFDPNPFSEVSKRNRAIRQLLLSDHMSELFKVLIATKKR